MADPVETPTAEPQALTFKTEDEKVEALTKLEESAETPPIDKTADEWQIEVDAKVKEALDAEVLAGETPPVETPTEPLVDAEPPVVPTPPVEPVAPAEPAAPVAPSTEPAPWYKLPEGVVVPEGLQLPKTPESAIKAWIDTQNHINFLKNERIPQLQTSEQAKYQAQIDELNKKIAAFETKPSVTPVAPVAPAAPPPPASRLDEINRLRAELDATPIDQRIDDENYYRKQSQLNEIMASELARTNALVNRPSAQPTTDPRVEAALKKIEAYEAQQVKVAEAAKAKAQQDEQQRLLDAAYQEIDSFVTAKDAQGNAKHPEFTLPVSYKDMNKVYEGFGADVARLLYQREPTNLNEVDTAVYTYLSGQNPALKQACDQRGIVAPNGLDNYLRTTEVHMHYTGSKLDPVTKQWVQNVNPLTKEKVVFSSLESALHDKKLQDGTWAQQLANAANTAARSVQQRITNPTDVAPLMPNQGGTNPADVEKPMDKQEAAKILNEFAGQEEEIIIAARVNPKDARFLTMNKALETLEMSPLEIEEQLTI